MSPLITKEEILWVKVRDYPLINLLAFLHIKKNTCASTAVELAMCTNVLKATW